MIRLLHNDLEGQYFVPLKGTDTPARIIQMKIEHGYDRNTSDYIWKIWIRGEKTIWFRVDQCFVNTVTECEEYVNLQERKRKFRYEG